MKEGWLKKAMLYYECSMIKAVILRTFSGLYLYSGVSLEYVYEF